MNASPQDLPLRDIHMPDPVSWWPPAPGWWLLALAVILLAIFVLMRTRKTKRSRTAKADSRLQLAALARDFREHQDEERLLRQLSSLLRRITLSCYPRTEVASLTGEEWLSLLDRMMGSDGFSRGPGRILAAGPYQPNATLDPASLLALCRDWVDALPEPDR